MIESQEDRERLDAYFEDMAIEHANSDALNDGIKAIHRAGWAAGRGHGFRAGLREGRSSSSGVRILGVWAAIALGIALGVWMFSVTLIWVQP